MLLSELFEYLVSGELSQVHMGDVTDLSIQVEDYPKIIPSVNLALIELYKRFPLKMDEVIIRQEDHIDTYTLDRKYAQSNTVSQEPIKYIHDSIYEPFTNNILKIESVHNELGNSIPLNQDVDYGEDSDYETSRYEKYLGHDWDYDFQSARTPGYNTIQILPHPISNNNLLIKYRATPASIDPNGDIVPGEIDLGVPLSMLEPLLVYVGGRTFANMHTEDPNAGAGFLARFEAACQVVEDLNLFNKDNKINTKLEQNGWR